MRSSDVLWFDMVIKNSPYGSYDRVAQNIMNSKGKALDRGGLWRRTHGEYGWTDDEIEQFARAVGEPLIECRRRAGMWIPGREKIAS